MTTLRVTYRTGYQGILQLMNVNAKPDVHHDALARIIALNLTGNAEHRHVINIVKVETIDESPLLDTLIVIVKYADIVNDYAGDFYDSEGARINVDYLMSERLSVIRRALTELDDIVTSPEAVASLSDGFLPAPPHAHLLAEIIERARMLVAAIRAAISSAVKL